MRIMSSVLDSSTKKKSQFGHVKSRMTTNSFQINGVLNFKKASVSDLTSERMILYAYLTFFSLLTLTINDIVHMALIIIKRKLTYATRQWCVLVTSWRWSAPGLCINQRILACWDLDRHSRKEELFSTPYSTFSSTFFPNTVQKDWESVGENAFRYCGVSVHVCMLEFMNNRKRK